jgi:hypothetical protein
VNIRIPFATAILAIASLSLIHSQGSPPAPENLRFVKNGDVVRPEPCVVPPKGGPSHAYFDSLVGLPQHLCNWSLRDQARLNAITNSGVSDYFTYAPSLDSHPFKQDGAKFFKPVDDQIGTRSDSIPGNKQLKMPIKILDGSVLITWDFWYGHEFIANRGTVGGYKIWQHRQNRAGRWWSHTVRFTEAEEPGEVGRSFDTLSVGQLNIPGVTKDEPYTPTGAGAKAGRTYGVYAGRWTRYW